MEEKKTEKLTATPDQSSEPESVQVKQIENAFLRLDDSFSSVAAIENPVKQEYELLQEAERLQVPVESYRRMFDRYCQQRESSQTSKFSWLKPVKILDMRLGEVVKWCENISLYGLATVLGQFTLLAAMGAYFMEGPQRHQASIDAARQEVRTQKGVEYSQSRIEAMQTLNQNCESLLGEQAPQANLEGIELNKCYKSQVGLESFAQWPPQFERYEGMDLSQMNLAGANLKGAKLQGANLEGTNLEGANLAGAKLMGANLKNANLKGANLRGANLENADLEEANLDATRMNRVSLKGANLEKASIINARLLWSNLQGAKLNQAILQDTNLNRANLQGADLYKADLKGASLRYADLRNGTITIGADLERANIKRAKFWTADQVKRAYNWEKAIKDADWEAKIAKPGEETYKVGFLVPDEGRIYKLYQQGIEKAAQENKKIQVVPVKTGDTVEAEAQGIKQLLAEDADVILLRPKDRQKSVPAIIQAYNAGAVVINIGDCLPEDAQRAIFACYESNSFQMGYDIGNYMGKWAKKKLPGQSLNVGILDGADSTTAYPYFQGFVVGLNASGASWSQAASTSAATLEDVANVTEMLQSNQKINVLWGGSEATTEIALQAVKQLGLEQKVSVFGVVPLTRQLGNMLINPNHPLQSIIDESPSYVGYKGTLQGIGIIDGTLTRDFQHIVYEHRLLTQGDQQAVNKSLADALDIEKNDLKAATPLKNDPAVIPTEIASSLRLANATFLPAITDKAAIAKLQEQLQKQIAQNWQTSAAQTTDQTAVKFSEDLIYRVLANKEGQVVSYEPVNQLAVGMVDKTPLPKLSKTEVAEQPQNVTVQPIAEYKVTFTPNGKVEVKWGESFLEDE